MADANSILEEVREERERQHGLAFGGNTNAFDVNNSMNDWVAYVSTYAGRASRKVFSNNADPDTFRNNMVKVAALAVAAIEAYDNGWAQ